MYRKRSFAAPFFYAEYSPNSDTYKSVLIRVLPVVVVLARVLVVTHFYGYSKVMEWWQ